MHKDGRGKESSMNDIQQTLHNAIQSGTIATIYLNGIPYNANIFRAYDTDSAYARLEDFCQSQIRQFWGEGRINN